MMKRYFTARRLFFVWICLATVLSWHGAADAAEARVSEVRVAVASNFIAPMKHLAHDFEAATGVEVLVSAGSTGKLYAQIKNGAPFDVFLAANAREPRRLENEGLGHARFTYAQGRLAVWCRDAQDIGAAQACLNTGRIAIANPRLAPYGEAAESVLARLNVATQGRLINGENIAQAFQLVWSGNVHVGFVALSQIKARGDTVGAHWVVPANLHDPIEQQAVLIHATAAAETFLAYLQSAKARTLIASYGYDVGDG